MVTKTCEGLMLRAACAVLLLAGACGPAESSGDSHAALCKQSITVSCDQTFKCSDPTTLQQSAEFIGKTVDECIKTQSAACTDNGICAKGFTYDAGAASRCNDAFAAQTCDDFNDVVFPEVCQSVCTSPSDGSAGVANGP